MNASFPPPTTPPVAGPRPTPRARPVPRSTNRSARRNLALVGTAATAAAIGGWLVSSGDTSAARTNDPSTDAPSVQDVTVRNGADDTGAGPVEHPAPGATSTATDRDDDRADGHRHGPGRRDGAASVGSDSSSAGAAPAMPASQQDTASRGS